MNTRSLKGPLAYESKACLRSMGIFALVVAAIWLVNITLVGVSVGKGRMTLGGMDSPVVIFCFVAGIISVREDLRLFLQSGRSRKTVFLCQCFCAVYFAVALSLWNVALMTGVSALVRLVTPGITVTIASMGTGMWSSMAYALVLCIAAFFLGMCISLIYYRLSKLGRVVFSVAVPGGLFVGLPLLASRYEGVGQWFVGLIQWLLRTFPEPLVLTSVCALFTVAVCGLGSWLLLRRAPVA